mmetsp:Transcript_11132/g.20140  ORF Transcript_11132/g.20140 Transcript_11132/m.20140 type:complete len:92 (+) Transcript_11132:1946-2221(+)
MKRTVVPLSGWYLTHDCAMAADAAAAEDDDTAADGARGAFVKNAEAKEGPLPQTARRIPADERKRSMSCAETMNSLSIAASLFTRKRVGLL